MQCDISLTRMSIQFNTVSAREDPISVYDTAQGHVVVLIFSLIEVLLEKQVHMETIHHLVFWILVVCHYTWSQRGKIK